MKLRDDGACNDVEDDGLGQHRRRSTFLLIPGKGEAVNRSSPTIMALSQIVETDSDIFHAVGASNNSVFTLSESSDGAPKTNMFDTSIKSESAKQTQSGNIILHGFAATRDCQMSLSVGLEVFFERNRENRWVALTR